MQSPTDQGLRLLGWREWVALPELGIPYVRAKIDTGARTSTLHAFKIEPYQQGERLMVRFWLHPSRRDLRRVVSAVAPVIDERLVTSSGGHVQERYVIRTPAVIAGLRHEIEITLANRDTMRFRMLLGRTALRDCFLIDTAASYLGGRLKELRARARTARTTSGGGTAGTSSANQEKGL